MFKTIKYATKIAKNKSQELLLYKKNFHDEKLTQLQLCIRNSKTHVNKELRQEKIALICKVTAENPTTIV